MITFIVIFCIAVFIVALWSVMDLKKDRKDFDKLFKK